MEDIDSLKKENRELHNHIIGYRLLAFLMSIALIGLIIGTTLLHDDIEEGKEALIDKMDRQYSKGYDDGKSDGYDYGYDDGYHEGYSEGYDEGEAFGYDGGFEAGYDSCYQENGDAQDNYNDGFNDGYDSAYEDYLNGTIIDYGDE